MCECARMRVYINDLSGATKVVDAHIVPETAVYETNFFNRVIA